MNNICTDTQCVYHTFKKLPLEVVGVTSFKCCIILLYYEYNIVCMIVFLIEYRFYIC